MTIDNIKIDIFPSKGNDTKTLAYVNLSFPIEIDAEQCNLKIDGYRIMVDGYGTSHDGYRLVPPSIKKGFKFTPIVFMDGDKNIWFKLESKILEQYEETSQEELNTTS